MRIYEAVPEGTARGGVIVIQEAFGVNEHIEDVTRRFAAAGYHAVSPALYHRQGDPTFEYGQFDKLIEVMGALSDDTILEDLDGARERLHERGFADPNIGAVGFCMGGRASFLLAVNRAIGAAVGFYGGGIVTARAPQFPALVGRVSEMKTPWLGLFGDDDGSIPVDDVETLRGELSAHAPVDTEIVRYAGAKHGFHCDLRPDYNEAAAKDGWARTLTWFEAHLAPVAANA
ncbi:MAG TPA: dienelactone hydrolase family protein [Acidimicrobiia bacterium]|jgi:carboxymethylenebutenolidase